MVRNPIALARAALAVVSLLLATPAIAADWQPFPNDPVDTSALLRGAIAAANGTLLAKSPTFNLTADEAEGVADVVFGRVARPQALAIEGNRYSIITSDAQGFYARAGNVGLVVAKGIDTIVLGVYDAAVPAARAMQNVQDIAAVLRSMGH